MAFYDSKVGKLYVAQYDLTAYTREMTPTASRPLHDVTVLGDDGRKRFGGTGENTFSWSGLFDDGAAGSDVIMDALRSATSAQVLTVWPGDTVAGNHGLGTDQLWLSDAGISTHVGNMVEMDATMEAGLWDRIRVNQPKVTKTGSTVVLGKIDGGAQSTAGGAWYYHVFAWSATGGNARWKLDFQDSADNTAFASLDSVNITAVGAARRALTGTIRRHTGYVLTLDATSGSITFLLAHLRS